MINNPIALPTRSLILLEHHPANTKDFHVLVDSTLIASSFFLLPSSFFLLPSTLIASSFFLLPSSFLLLTSSFFLTQFYELVMLN
ncbi:MAG: hypothetical protein ACRCT1_21340 [Microcoleaceae cyanobacterium]